MDYDYLEFHVFLLLFLQPLVTFFFISTCFITCTTLESDWTEICREFHKNISLSCFIFKPLITPPLLFLSLAFVIGTCNSYDNSLKNAFQICINLHVIFRFYTLSISFATRFSFLSMFFYFFFIFNFRMEPFGGAFSDVESMSRIQTTTDSNFRYMLCKTNI